MIRSITLPMTCVFSAALWLCLTASTGATDIKNGSHITMTEYLVAECDMDRQEATAISRALLNWSEEQPGNKCTVMSDVAQPSEEMRCGSISSTAQSDYANERSAKEILSRIMGPDNTCSLFFERF